MKTLCSRINSWLTKQRTSILIDGTVVVKPLSLSIIGWLATAFIFIYFWDLIVGSYFERVTFNFFVSRIPSFFSILNEMALGVDWAYFSRILEPMADTLKMSIMGTVLGAALSLPVAFLASQNIIKNRYTSVITKFALSLIRTFPTLVYALIFAFIFGYGTFVGVVATVIFTFGIMTKLLYEFIETIDLGAFVAIESTGAGKIRSFRTSIIPQITGIFISTFLYMFEINIRSSAILGFVGAGGIGIMLNDSMGLRNYGRVSLMLIVLLTTVILIENASRYIRARLT
jgi:phosphonate transport system permease protein